MYFFFKKKVWNILCKCTWSNIVYYYYILSSVKFNSFVLTEGRSKKFIYMYAHFCTLNCLNIIDLLILKSGFNAWKCVFYWLWKNVEHKIWICVYFMYSTWQLTLILADNGCGVTCLKLMFFVMANKDSRIQTIRNKAKKFLQHI